MKKEFVCVCNAFVEGDDKYKPFIQEFVDKFTECIECCFELGFVKSIKLDVHLIGKEKK